MGMSDSGGDIAGDFLAAMRSAGVDMDTASNKGGHPIADGKLHRATALNKRSKRNLHVWYVLYPDAPASGAFGDYQLGISDTWTAKKPDTMSDEERRALKKRMEQARREREEDQKRIHAEAATAAEKILASTTKAKPDHPYLANKNLPPFPGLRQLSGDVTYKVDGETKKAFSGNLVVPMVTPEGKIASAQMIAASGRKLFVKGGAKKGNYTSVGKPGDRIVIAEGYATAARIHQATGLCVIVAFDSGNLPDVSRNIRRKYPDADIVIAADNDRFTKKPDGTLTNPGVEKARESAVEIKALVAVPLFDDSALTPEEIEEGKFPTDFDDVFRLEGLHAIKSAIDAPYRPGQIVTSPPEREETPPPSDEPPGDWVPDGPEYNVPEGDPGPDGFAGPGPDYGDPDDIIDDLEVGDGYFRCIGIDDQTLYFLPYKVCQIQQISLSQLTETTMIRLANLNYWETEFGNGKGKVDWTAAKNALIQGCLKKHLFVEHERIRGRGAWFEGDRAVYHAGDHLVVDGKAVDIPKHHSRYVYSERSGIPVALGNPSSNAETRDFLRVCKSLRWSSGLSGYMLAGFCVLGPVCGFLDWRPHIWVNGPAGAGKSTVIRDIVRQVMGKSAISVVGSTTEAGIRNTLGMDALPIVFDEAEPKDMHNQARIRSILDLARVASSESDGLIVKGTSNQSTKAFRARFMAIFASINAQIEGYADETRFTQLNLNAPDKGTPEKEEAEKARYAKLKADIHNIVTPEFSRRLLARTIHNLPRLKEYVEVFIEAATEHLGTRRLGDQVGPLLAGAYLLHTTSPLTKEAAMEWIRKNDFTAHSAAEAQSDQERLLSVITSHMVRHNTPEHGQWERPVGELIEMAAESDKVKEYDSHFGGYTEVENKKKAGAVFALARLGIRVKDDGLQKFVHIATGSNGCKGKVLAKTEWAGANFSQLLKSIEGATTGGNDTYFAPSVKSRYVSIPMNSILGWREPGEEG